jgi:hypothetical protein
MARDAERLRRFENDLKPENIFITRDGRVKPRPDSVRIRARRLKPSPLRQALC